MLASGINCSWTLERHTRSYNHLEGDVRLRRLYSANKFFLCIDKTGKVDGTRRKNYADNLMEIRSVSVGVVAIKSVSTGLYLAMSKKGTLFGSVRIQPGNIVPGGQDGRVGKGTRVVRVGEVYMYRGPKCTPTRTCLILLK